MIGFWKRFIPKWLLQTLNFSAIVIICSMFGIGSQYLLLCLIVIVSSQQSIYSINNDLVSKEHQKHINHLYFRISVLEKFVLKK